jgi:hypothetical protein
MPNNTPDEAKYSLADVKRLVRREVSDTQIHRWFADEIIPSTVITSGRRIFRRFTRAQMRHIAMFGILHAHGYEPLVAKQMVEKIRREFSAFFDGPDVVDIPFNNLVFILIGKDRKGEKYIAKLKPEHASFEDYASAFGPTGFHVIDAKEIIDAVLNVRD